MTDEETAECPKCGRDSRSGIHRDDNLCIVCLSALEERGELPYEG